MILFYLCVLLMFNSIQCTKWKDPYDMLSIHMPEYRDDSPKKCSEDNEAECTEPAFIKQTDNINYLPAKKCPDELGVVCLNMLHELLASVSRQLPVIAEDSNHEATLELYLSPRDIELIKLFTKPSQISQSEICSVLHESLTRASNRSSYDKFMEMLASCYNVLCDRLYDIMNLFSFTSVSISRKAFILLQVSMIFLTSILLLFKFRSISLLIFWILFCFFFLSVYTSYENLYQEAVSKKEALIAQHGFKVPDHCHHSTRRFIHWVFGTEDCKEFFLAHNVQPEVTVHLTDVAVDIFANVFIRFVTNSFTNLYDAVHKITGSSMFRYITEPIMLIIALIFFCAVLFICLKSYLDTFVSQSINRNSIHSNTVEHLPPRPSVSGIEDIVYTVVASRRDNERFIQEQLESPKSKKSFRRLKSAKEMRKISSQKEVVPLISSRRLSL